MIAELLEEPDTYILPDPDLAGNRYMRSLYRRGLA